MPQDSTNFDGEEFRQLISAWCDGVISDADLARLQSTLSASSAARQMYFEYMDIHIHAQGEAAAQEYLESITPIAPTQPVEGILPFAPPTGLPIADSWPRIFFRHGGAWAAIFLIAALAWGGMKLSRSAKPDAAAGPSIAASENNHNSTATIVAQVTDQTADCQWFIDQGSSLTEAAVQGVRSGDTLRVAAGRMKLKFTNGTVVTLQAPALFQILSGMKTRLLLGKATTHVAEGAEGFAVITPRATVTDLGTEFGIDVSALGATDVVVFKGEVDLDYGAAEEGPARQQRLKMGEALHLDNQGTASRLVSITNQQFPDELEIDSLPPPVITDVRDNIPRGAWNFYEIVPSGMAEDAKAFVDREAHEWNGLTKAGMPSYLIGGDYVKTFNNDKLNHDIEITVTLDRPAKLYVLFDDRIPPPAWLKQQFTNTGDKVGFDEGPYKVNNKWRTDHQPGVGPGSSIDNVASVWVREVKNPGPVHLGATETPIPYINMYGIVAVPLDK